MNDLSRYRDRGEPSNVTSIERRLLWLAREQGVPINHLRHRFAVIVLADLMSTITVDDTDPVFLVKGGTAMLLRYGITRSRLSKDLDAAVASAIDPSIEELRARGREPFRGFTAQVTKDAPIILPGGGVPPRRLSVKITYKGSSFATIKVELSVAEGSSSVATIGSTTVRTIWSTWPCWNLPCPTSCVWCGKLARRSSTSEPPTRGRPPSRLSRIGSRSTPAPPTNSKTLCLQPWTKLLNW